ncbi:unnamed protein product [Boreogadus saida]
MASWVSDALMNSAVGEECFNTGPPYWPRRSAGDRSYRPRDPSSRRTKGTSKIPPVGAQHTNASPGLNGRGAAGLRAPAPHPSTPPAAPSDPRPPSGSSSPKGLHSAHPRRLTLSPLKEKLPDPRNLEMEVHLDSA